MNEFITRKAQGSKSNRGHFPAVDDMPPDVLNDVKTEKMMEVQQICKIISRTWQLISVYYSLLLKKECTLSAIAHIAIRRY